MSIKVLTGCMVAIACAAPPLFAQGPPQPPVQTRPATTATTGDTGLWFVPTGEVLPARNWSFSAYRVNFDYDQGFTDVSRWPVTFGAGLADRVELFGAFTVVTRIDRDVRPLFFAVPNTAGGVVNDHPFVNDGWSGNQLGDLWLGAKFNLTSQHRQAPAAFALRGMLKVPTASKDDGAGTRKFDFAVDAIVSREVNERAELSAFGGLILRGDPDEFDLLNGFRWGVGAGLPTRRNLRLTAELHGEAYLGDAVKATGVLPAVIAGVPPVESPQRSPVNASIGLTWQGRNGLFAGTGVNYNLRLNGRGDYGAFSDETGDALGFQFRVGYHPGVRVYVAPPPPEPPPAAPENRPPTVRARCEPCTVEIGKTATVAADATDPDGDALTYRWSAAAGTLANPSDRQSSWTAPMQEGPVPVTVEVTDTRGARATDAVTIQVIRPAVKEFVFEDVHFDFDRYSLRPEATRALDEAIKALQENAELRIQVEGHTCNIGTAEYNLALGERRAGAVREYLTSRGVSGDRLQAVSYGEERPKHDNAREETRRLNRRAALVVRVQR
ncbi:MAG TPA: OmpA family protein [Vicinamibacterales bacterium]|nr:OmpA family protein [Vicinamibacterales bacterium]